MEPRTKTCGPIRALILTHAHILKFRVWGVGSEGEAEASEKKRKKRTLLDFSILTRPKRGRKGRTFGELGDRLTFSPQAQRGSGCELKCSSSRWNTSHHLQVVFEA